MALKCDACGATSFSEYELREHNKMHMKAAAPAPHTDYRCNACGAIFHSPDEFQRHAAQAHQM